MFFLQQRFSDEVVVSTMPHPFSMFLLGFTLFALIILLLEYRRAKGDMKDIRRLMKDLEQEVKGIEGVVDKKLSDISKKVDSRVDKAIVALKKQDK
jgi:hypothetical protein